MKYIKQSFKRNFLLILIFSAVLAAAGKAMEWPVAALYGLFADETVTVQENFLDYLSMLEAEDNWYTSLISLLGTLIVSPLWIGLYRFCFIRLQGGNPKFVSLFDFYKAPKKLFGSFFARSVMGAAIAVAMGVLGLTIIRFIIFAEEDYDMHSVTFSSTWSFSTTAVLFIVFAVTAVITLFFWFTEYSYALFSEDGVVNAIRNSFAVAKRYWLKILGIMALCAVVDYLLSALILEIGFYFSPVSLLAFVITVVTTWIGTTFAHAVLAGDKPKAEPADEKEEENEDDLIVKPYDFFIEADTRFTDSTTIESEAIREVDILAVLDEMNLADEVKTNWFFRKKLKRLFDDLAFEVGEYVSYEGGHEISGTETEELDERELEISVEISRGSDSEPFTAVISISEVEE